MKLSYTAGYFNSTTKADDKDQWRTPKEIFNALDKEFRFTTDVAASDKNHLLPHYFTKEQNALGDSIKWGQVNWCNPPYSKIEPWIQRCIIEQTRFNTTVMLVPADTSTKWFQLAFSTASEIRFITGRLEFTPNNGEINKKTGNNKGSVIFIWRAGYQGSLAVSTLHRDYLMRLGKYEDTAS